jgi:hypothetical protein
MITVGHIEFAVAAVLLGLIMLSIPVYLTRANRMRAAKGAQPINHLSIMLYVLAFECGLLGMVLTATRLLDDVLSPGLTMALTVIGVAAWLTGLACLILGARADDR